MAGKKKYYTLKELCEILSVSEATGKNWIKTNKITPQKTDGKNILFDKKYTDSLVDKIKKSKTILKSRRNKKHASGNFLYKDYIDPNSPNAETLKDLIEYIKNNYIEPDKLLLSILSKTAKDLISQKYKNISQDEYYFLLTDLTKENNIPKWLDRFKFKYIENEDTLGFLYISLNNISNRKSSGSYYTPVRIVKKLCAEIFKSVLKPDIKILDPCCGSGNFLLNLPSDIDFNNIYGSDIDSIAIKLARINMFLKFGIRDKNTLYSHIKELDFLFENPDFKFDYIIGNPPWAFEFSKTQKQNLKNLYKSAQKTNIESYDVVTEKALLCLKKDGKLSFVLPQAILNVKTHELIRQIICKSTSVDYIEYLGEVFSNVQCPSIILSLTNTQKNINSIGTKVKTRQKTFEIKIKRDITPDNFSFTMTDKEYKILNKINNIPYRVFLKNNSTFALGIVTGDNKKYLQNKKTARNEIIIKGTDVIKYGYKTPSNYIEFENNSFQQVAPVELYRAKEKLLYKFISKKLVFSYDNKQRLTLNSCNILIPDITGVPIKYILAILNSNVAQFYFSKKYNSAKVLRSHIESIPIPVIDKTTQDNIIDIVNKLILSDKPEKTDNYKKLDKIIAGLYNLTEEEYSLICQ